MQSVANLREQLQDIKRRRDNKKREARKQTDEIKDAIDAIDNCKDSLTTTPFAAGMSSLTLEVINEMKLKIRSTYLSYSIDPAKDALVQAKDSLGDL